MATSGDGTGSYFIDYGQGTSTGTSITFGGYSGVDQVSEWNNYHQKSLKEITESLDEEVIKIEKQNAELRSRVASLEGRASEYARLDDRLKFLEDLINQNPHQFLNDEVRLRICKFDLEA